MNRRELEDELERLHPSCWGWALSCCRGEREEALDVLQTSYLKVLDGRARFDGLSTLRTFLFGVVRRTALEARRREALRRLSLRRAAQQAPPETAAAEASDEAVERLRRELALLAPRQRQVLELVFQHGLTIAEASSILGVSVGAARAHYERGKRRLRQRLRQGR